MSQRIKNWLLYSIIFLLIVLVGISFDKNSIVYQIVVAIIMMAFWCSAFWIIPLSLFHIFYHKKTSLWHIIFSELFLLMYSIITLFYFSKTCSGEGCMGGAILFWISFGALFFNPIIQLIISYFKKKKFGNIQVQEEGLLPRVINVDDKN